MQPLANLWNYKLHVCPYRGTVCGLAYEQSIDQDTSISSLVCAAGYDIYFRTRTQKYQKTEKKQRCPKPVHKPYRYESNRSRPR